MTDKERKKVRSMICSNNTETRVLGMKLSSSDVDWLLSLFVIGLSERVISFNPPKPDAHSIDQSEYNKYPDLFLLHNGKYYRYRKYTSYIGIFLIEEIIKEEYDRGTKDINWKDDSE
jgi:hypothetical protein